MRRIPALALALPLLLVAGAAQPHFQELIPSPGWIDRDTDAEVRLELTFTHPMAGGPAMEMGAPEAFGVLSPRGRQDLTGHLEPVRVDGSRAYRGAYAVERPGDYVFFLEPAPYWEPAEGKLIIHYTKVVVGAYGGGSEWDARVGFPVEIDPLVRPYGLWSGNLFRGVVTRDGEPVPFAEVEVEWRNDGSLDLPESALQTQVIRADGAGVFAYAMPRAGWWGFSAVLESGELVPGPEGEAVPVETGALIWVETRDMQ